MQKTIFSDRQKILLQWLKSKRRGCELTQRRLAEILDVQQSWIAKIELGERRLDVIEYVELCEAMKIDPMEGIQKILSETAACTPKQR